MGHERAATGQPLTEAQGCLPIAHRPPKVPGRAQQHWISRPTVQGLPKPSLGLLAATKGNQRAAATAHQISSQLQQTAVAWIQPQGGRQPISCRFQSTGLELLLDAPSQNLGLQHLARMLSIHS
jgi:hypothetical protein